MILPAIRLILFNVVALLLLLGLPFCTAGQDRELRGFLGVEGGESFSFLLRFTDSVDTIAGHSFVWSEEGKEVQATISGTIDRARKTLSFRETAIIANRGFQSRATLCLIAAVLQYQTEDGQPTLSGKITSSDITQVSCAQGSISFPGGVQTTALFQEPVPMVVTGSSSPAVAPRHKKPDVIRQATARPALSPVMQQEQAVIITEGKNREYNWHSDSVIIGFRDGGRVDGDVISVWINEKPVLQDYTILATYREVHFLLTDTAVITILAREEGNEPPNTIDILLRDGTIQHHLSSHNKKGKKAVIRIRKMP